MQYLDISLADIHHVAAIVAAFGIITAVVQLLVHKKKLHLDTISRCVTVFRKHFAESEKWNESKANDFIDFVNEELFYIQYNYIPKAIAFEWIDGMIDILPLYNSQNKLLNENFVAPVFRKTQKEFFENYPRVKTVLTISTDHPFLNWYSTEAAFRTDRNIEREAIIKEMYQNLKNYHKYRYWRLSI